MNVLFVCSRNRIRSPTPEVVFAEHPGLTPASAGTAPDAETVVSADLLEWAQLIFVMEPIHRRRVQQKFGEILMTRKLVVLNIPDNYGLMDEALVALLIARVTPHLNHAPPRE